MLASISWCRGIKRKKKDMLRVKRQMWSLSPKQTADITLFTNTSGEENLAFGLQKPEHDWMGFRETGRWNETDGRRWKKHQKMSKRQTERDARSERPTFAGIIRVHWLQSTRALSQMAQATIHLLFWFICWYITATAASSYFLFALAVHHNLHLDALVERKDSAHTHIRLHKGVTWGTCFTQQLCVLTRARSVWLVRLIIGDKYGKDCSNHVLQIFFVMLQLQSGV